MQIVRRLAQGVRDLRGLVRGIVLVIATILVGACLGLIGHFPGPFPGGFGEFGRAALGVFGSPFCLLVHRLASAGHVDLLGLLSRAA